MTLLLALGADTLDLDDYDTNGIYVAKVDLGWPDVRDDANDLPDRDGVADYTRWMGGRVVTLAGQVIETELSGPRQAILDKLRRYCVPSARPTLTVAAKGDAPRVITLRADQHSAPLESPGRAEFAVSWRAPDPRLYAAAPSSETVLPPTASADGRMYDLLFNRTYPGAYGGSGIVVCHNAGTTDTWPRFAIYGPITNPSITNVDTGEAVATTGLTIPNGSYLTIETETRAVYLNGDPNADRYANIDVAATTWFPLRPGDNTLRFTGTNYASPTQAVITWTDAYL